MIRVTDKTAFDIILLTMICNSTFLNEVSIRSSVENITILQERINNLQLENQVLKNILDRSGISYKQELRSFLVSDVISEYDPNQGARIQWPPCLTNEMVDLVFTRFQGRLDVYARRFEKKTGRMAARWT